MQTSARAARLVAIGVMLAGAAGPAGVAGAAGAAGVGAGVGDLQEVIVARLLQAQHLLNLFDALVLPRGLLEVEIAAEPVPGAGGGVHQ